ncbi:MAG: frataxin domain-containing protein [Pseudomonadota bacterium]
MEKSPFGKFIDETLRYIQKKTEAALGPTATIERTEDTLIIELESGQQYLLNSLDIRQGIGLASPLSGRRVFYYDKGKDGWIAIRDGVDLYDLLEDELSQICGVSFKFN